MTAILLKTHTIEADGIPCEEWEVTHNGALVGLIYRRTYVRNRWATVPIIRYSVYTVNSDHPPDHEFVGLWRNAFRALAALRRRVRGAAL